MVFKMPCIASTRAHMGETIEEEQMKQRQESLVRDGLTPSPMAISSPMRVITTSAEIQLIVKWIDFGAYLLTPTFLDRSVQFQFSSVLHTSLEFDRDQRVDDCSRN